MPTLRERIAGGMYGLLVGDALGVPYEFHGPAQLPPRELLEFEPPRGFSRAHGGVPPGTAFEDIPDDWFCPVCGARKRDFTPYEG